VISMNPEVEAGGEEKFPHCRKLDKRCSGSVACSIFKRIYMRLHMYIITKDKSVYPYAGGYLLIAITVHSQIPRSKINL